MVNVSEKTLDELKTFKNEEEIKSLDGTVRYLLERSPQNMEVESSGPWPKNAITDINVARCKLIQKMRFPKWGKFIASTHLSRSLLSILDRQLPNTNISYRTFLIKNGLSTTHKWVNAENDVAVIRSEDYEVIIRNIKHEQ